MRPRFLGLKELNTCFRGPPSHICHYMHGKFNFRMFWLTAIFHLLMWICLKVLILSKILHILKKSQKKWWRTWNIILKCVLSWSATSKWSRKILVCIYHSWNHFFQWGVTTFIFLLITMLDSSVILLVNLVYIIRDYMGFTQWWKICSSSIMYYLTVNFYLLIFSFEFHLWMFWE